MDIPITAYLKGLSSWTVRSHEAAQFLIDLKVDAIITDYPDYVNLRNGIK